LSKVHIYDSNVEKWKAVLLNNVPADQIPVFYGGTATKALVMFQVPFKEVERLPLKCDNDLQYASVLERAPGSLEILPSSNRFVEKILAPGSELKLEFIVDRAFSKLM
jgi:hypothetical protein